VLSRLEAIANGVSVDRRSNLGGNLMVRGLSTINGNRQPLIILDNFPYQGNVENLNPNDMESITILKDAAATSIWGARAGNGVIVMTSKQGKRNTPLAIEFSGNVNLTEQPDLLYLQQLTSADFIDLEKDLYARGFYDANINSVLRPPLSPVVELLVANSKGLISTGDLNTSLSILAGNDVRKALLESNYQKAFRQQYAISLQLGGEQLTTYVSAGYDRNISDLGAAGSRLSFNYKSMLRLSDRLSISWQGLYTETKNGNGRAGYQDLANGSNQLFPYLSLRDAQGNPVAVAKNYSMSYLDSMKGYLDWNYYPADDYLHQDLSVKVGDLMGNIGVNYKILNGLAASVQYRYEEQRSSNRNYYDPESYMARLAVNQYTQIAGANTIYKVPMGGILGLEEGVMTSQQLRGQLNWSQRFGSHDFSVLGGSEVSNQKNISAANQRYGYREETLAYGNVDFTTPYPNSVTGFSDFIFPGNNALGERLTRFVSFYGNAGYSYKNRYLLNASVRRDASNVFGVASNDKWKPLWSVGAGWIVSDEGFYTSVVFNRLKLRLSYGKSGNVDPGRSALATIISTGTSPFTGTNASRFNTYANPELRWEQVATINAGVDFEILQSRISGSIDAYTKRATDLYGTALVDYTAVPSTTLTKNVAKIQSRGIDLMLNSRNMSGAFQWNSQLNLSIYRDRILEYYLPSYSGQNLVSTGNSVSPLAGYPVYAMFSYRFGGLSPLNGNPQGYEKGVISTNYTSLTGTATTVDDLVYSGSVFPTVFGGLGNQFRYRNLTLDVQMTYKLGYYFKRQGINYSNLYNQGIGHSDYSMRWQRPGDEINTQVPSAVYPAESSRDEFYNMSDVLVEKGDHIRLAFVNLSYTFNERLSKRIGLKRLQLTAGASNLGILWRANQLGIDPDYQIGAIPPSKTFSFGFRAGY
ncbi:MAG: SusC/RagA family TonB-linked outer membrane protein, partial [Pedobacter sp.]